MQKKNVLKIVLGSCVVIGILLICIIVRVSFDRNRLVYVLYHNQIDQEIYPLDDIMRLCGYQKTEELCYEKSTVDQLINITFNLEEGVCYKNQYRFEVSESLCIEEGKVFLRKNEIEEILNVDLTIERGRIVVRGKVYVQHEWMTAFPPFIAHAGGGLSMDESRETYTNSKEALTQNYNLGHRVFEFDFTLTFDGKLAAVHDWEQFGYKDGTILSAQQWKELKVSDDYSTALAEDILDEMLVNKDIFIVTDTKVASSGEECAEPIQILYNEAIKKDPQLLERIIPQIYNEEMYTYIMDIYNWPSVIYTIYANGASAKQIIEFSGKHDNIKVITMPIWDERFDKDAIEALHYIGKRVYKHTVNDYDEFLILKSKGVDGLYTDWLTAQDYIKAKDTDMKEENIDGLACDTAVIPVITKVTPDYLVFDENLVQNIMIEGENFDHESVVAINGNVYEPAYENGTLKLSVPFSEWCMADKITIQVKQYHNGYWTPIESISYDVGIDRGNLPQYGSENMESNSGIQDGLEMTRDWFMNEQAMLQYLQCLKDKRYVVFFSVKDEASKCLTEKVEKEMLGLGLKQSLKNAWRNGYLAIINEGTIIFEELDEGHIKFDGEIDGLKIHTESAGADSGNISSVKLNGNEYSLNQRGLNIVVYDKTTKTVIDRICFDLYDQMKIIK